MSVRNALGSSIALSLALIAGCRDVVAPVTAAYQQVSGLISNAISCSVTWKDPVSGMWTDAARWSTSAVPGASDDVCITLDGTYTVTLRGTRTVNTVTVGAAGNTGIQTLNVQGVATAQAALLTAANGIENHGVILINGAGIGAGSCSVAVTNGSLNNASTGTVQTGTGCASPGSVITADFVNDGTMKLDGVTTFDRTDGHYVNNGTFAVSANHTLDIINNGTFVQAGGTLSTAAANLFEQHGGTFQLDGGTITGTPRLLEGVAIAIGAASTAQGTLLVWDASTISGDVQNGQVIHVQGVIGHTSSITANASFTNHGILRLQGAGNSAQACGLIVASGTLTNEGTGRIESPGGCGGAGPTLSGEIVNLSTISIGVTTTIVGGTLRNVPPGTITGNQRLAIGSGARFHGGGAISVNIHNSGEFSAGSSPGLLAVTGTFIQVASGIFTAELGGPTPGVEYDRVTFTGSANIQGTLNVTSVNGTCVEPGVFEILTYSSRVNDFTTKSGVNLGPGHVLTTQPGSTNYRVTVSGPPCVAPDVTPPVIVPTVTGTLGDNGWYVSDVSVTWSVTDAESAISSSSGCDATTLSSDNAGMTYTCSATSDGGTSTQSVTVKRDATAPTVSASRAPAANANGWNNTDVTATWTASDGMSGLVGSGAATELFSAEGVDQGGSRTFSDNAGNTATASVTGISIDKTAPTVTVTRTPPPGPDGWNETPVTVDYAATDALSGIDGAATFSEVFSALGENQSGSHTFTDQAGNSATGTIAGINIRAPAPLVVSCSATPNEIWPPNNKMVAVHVTISGSGIASYTLTSVTNNQSGSSDVTGWSIGGGDLDGSVLATRLGSGARVYTLTYDVTSTTGQATSCAVTVTVPHDLGKRK